MPRTPASVSSPSRKIFVCSDWHLGGDPDDGTKIGSQICRSARALTGFIDWIAAESRAHTGTTEIVVNGDMVDFLAPAQGSTPLEWIAGETQVITRLDRIIELARTGSDRGPFEALADFLQQERTELTLLLGNHDLELSLPRVRRHLESKLGAKLRFIYDGEPLVRGRLLIEHGNRYDAWNAVDHSRLRQERSHLARGLRIEERDRDERFFRAPAGTYLVVHGINTVLAKYPFINLLKPENDAALPLLLTLEPDLRSVINLCLKLSPVAGRRLFRGRLTDPTTPAEPGRMSGVDAASVEVKSIDQALTNLLGNDAALFPAPSATSAMGSPASTCVTESLWNRSRAIAAAIAARLDLSAIAQDAIDAVKFRRLEIAFQKLQGAKTFDPASELPEYLDAAKAMMGTGKLDVVVFGHTHLQKRIEVERGEAKAGLYLNTGSWADVIRLPPKCCETTEAGRQARKQFLLEMAAHNIKPHLFTSLGYAEIDLAGEEVASAELRSYTTGNPRARPLEAFR